MPAFNAHVVVPKGVWTLMTASDITEFTCQNHSKTEDLYLAPAVGVTPPASLAASGAIVIGPRDGLERKALTTWLGLAGANRVYAFSIYQAIPVMFSHA